MYEDGGMRRTKSSVEIQRYAEEDDEDFSDIFGRDDTIDEKDESDYGSENGKGTLMLHSKLSNNSWLGDEDDEDDPFAQLEQGFDEMDLAANVARDKHARLCSLIEGLVSSLKITEEHDILDDLSEQLVCFRRLVALATATNVHILVGCFVRITRCEKSDYWSPWNAASSRNSGTLYGEKSPKHDSAAAEGRQYGTLDHD